MKRFFLILISVVASFGLYAETGGKEVVVKTSMDNSEVLLATVEIELSEVIYPYVITVPAPSETVLSISGPSQPNIGSWYISGGYLIISFRHMDFLDLEPGEKSRIDVYTGSGNYYYIQLDCK